MNNGIPVVIMRGGGDLASGVALRLYRAGIKVIITELPQPLVVRRLVAFANAVYTGTFEVEGVTSLLVDDVINAIQALSSGQIPLFIDPASDIRLDANLDVRAIIDARMLKRPPELGMDAAPLVIGLGPGFVAGENCHAVIETMRGHYLGRVIWDGPPQPNTGIPGTIASQSAERVLRAPADGTLRAVKELGSRVKSGDVIAEVDGKPIHAPFDGILRGLVYDGLDVFQGMKVGDVDPRDDPRFAWLVSEKSLAIGGGVLEALLTNPEIRQTLWS
jgi:xanthine dehydrogenase accessory factor